MEPALLMQESAPFVHSIYCWLSISFQAMPALLEVLRQVALNRTNIPVRDFGVNLHRGEAEDELEVVALAALKGNGNLLLDDVLLIRVFLAVSCAPCI